MSAPARLWKISSGRACFIFVMYWLKSVVPVGTRSLPTSVPWWDCRRLRATRSRSCPNA